MRRAFAASILLLSASCAAQNVCKPELVVQDASRVLTLQHELGQIQTGEMDLDVPPLVSDRVTELRNALSDATNAAMACSEPAVNASDLQHKLAQAFHANSSSAAASGPINTGGQTQGSYGGDLQIQVSRPAEVSGLLEIKYAFGIECGVDTLLQVYQVRDGAWIEKLRWEAPKLKTIADAFGDFFMTSFIHKPTVFTEEGTTWLLAVAHGTPWCTSRFSGFQVDLLAPSSKPTSPRLVWHIARDYSRSDFEITMKSLGDTFELRLNADCMSFDADRCFERRVIYRYRVDSREQVRRVNPLALNARGFVSEWIRSPWSEAKAFSTKDVAGSLERVHNEFNAPSRPDSSEYVSNSYGPVFRCKVPETYQVEIGSTLDKIVPGKPGGDSSPLPSRYFRVRATGDGYIVLSAPRRPDPSCSGRDLMPPTN